MKKMEQVFRPRRRRFYYVLFGIGSQLVSYAAGREWIGADEMALWTGIGTVVGFGAAAKVNVPKRGRHKRRQRDVRG